MNLSSFATQALITPLHIAALKGYFSVVECLIKSGADVNLVEMIVSLLIFIEHDYYFIVQTQSTPLHTAVFNGHTSIIELLLKSGADINAVTSDHYVIITVMSHQIISFCNYTQDKMTPIHIAAKNGNDLVMNLLIRSGADIYATKLVLHCVLLYMQCYSVYNSGRCKFTTHCCSKWTYKHHKNFDYTWSSCEYC